MASYTTEYVFLLCCWRLTLVASHTFHLKLQLNFNPNHHKSKMLSSAPLILQLPGGQFNTCFKGKCLATIGWGYWLCSGSLNINKYVNDKPLETKRSHPACLFMWVGWSSPRLGPNPSFTSESPAIQCVWLLSLNGCPQTNFISHNPLASIP